MRTPMIVANWKMHKTSVEAAQFIQALLSKDLNSERDIAVCGPFTTLTILQQQFDDSNIFYGSQNMHWEESGAYTGEISTSMLLEVGCQIVILGHSERRQYFNETDDTVNKKVKAALETMLTPIICVGETLELRKNEKTLEHVTSQVKAALVGVDKNDYTKLVFAYEPIWAIGTGETATAGQAQEVHAAIRKIVGDDTRILYGGSVKPDNISELMQQPDIDGALVGGASLEVETFAEIINYK